MNAKRLRDHWRRSWRRHLATAAKLLRRPGPLNPEAVHALRVALRRCRLLLTVAGKSPHRARRRAFRAAARAALDQFAPVRDLDVTIEWAAAQHASPAILARLHRRRALAALRADRALAGKRAALRPGRVRKTGRTDAGKLARRHRRWLTALANHCRAQARRARQLSIPQLHELRREIRRWRYLRELEVRANHPAVTRLVAAQEALGGVQNSEVVLKALRAVRAPRGLLAQARLEWAASRKLAVRELARCLGGKRN